MKRAKAVRRGDRTVRLPVLGIDVGGVLVDRAAEDSDTSFFGGRPMETPEVEGAFAAVASLAELFEYRVHVVSKAGPKISALTLEWLRLRGFYERTGLSPGNVRFVRKRPEKAPICEELGITHFIDDRPDVLECLTTVDHLYLFVGGLGANPAPTRVSPVLHVAESWQQIEHHITGTILGGQDRR